MKSLLLVDSDERGIGFTQQARTSGVMLSNWSWSIKPGEERRARIIIEFLDEE